MNTDVFPIKNKTHLCNAWLSAMTSKQHYFRLRLYRLKGLDALKTLALLYFGWIEHVKLAAAERVSSPRSRTVRGNVSQSREKGNVQPFLSPIDSCQISPLLICITLISVQLYHTSFMLIICLLLLEMANSMKNEGHSAGFESEWSQCARESVYQ